MVHSFRSAASSLATLHAVPLAPAVVAAPASTAAPSASAAPTPASSAAARPPATFREALGPRVKPGSDHPVLPRRHLGRNAILDEWYLYWHGIAIDTTGLDHTPRVRPRL